MPFRLLAQTPMSTVRVDMAVTPITTAAWTELVSALDKACTAVEIFNPSGSTMKISNGAAAAEDASELPYTILPGGSALLLAIPLSKGMRLSAKALDNDATTNLFIMNFFG